MKSIFALPKRLWRFLVATNQELRRVSWPTRAQTLRLTGIVVGVCVVLGSFLASLDYLLSQGLKLLLK